MSHVRISGFFSTLLTVVLFIAPMFFLLPFIGNAQPLVGEPIDITDLPVKEDIQIELVANINSEAQLASQADGTFEITFDIINFGTRQSNIKYGVLLVKQTDEYIHRVDHVVYPDILTLPEGKSFAKSIRYTPPPELQGEYHLFFEARNEDGLPLTSNALGSVTLTRPDDVLVIETESCLLSLSEAGTTTYTLEQGVDFSSDEELLLTCSATNYGSVTRTAAPVYATFNRTMYGSPVATNGGTVSDITFPPQETKEFSLVIPEPSEPQAYDLEVILLTEDDPTNSVFVHYVLQGPSATIQDVQLNKGSYEPGETAEVVFYWTAAADGFYKSRQGNGSASAVTAEVYVRDAKGSLCSEVVTQAIDPTVAKVTTELSVTKKCIGAEAGIVLKDAQDNVLVRPKAPRSSSSTEPINYDELLTTEEESSGPISPLYATIFGLLLAVALIAAIALIGTYIKRRNMNKDEKQKDVLTKSLLLLAIIGGSLSVSESTAHAYTFLLSPWQSTIQLSTDKNAYDINENIYVRGAVTSQFCSNQGWIDYRWDATNSWDTTFFWREFQLKGNYTLAFSQRYIGKAPASGEKKVFNKFCYTDYGVCATFELPIKTNPAVAGQCGSANGGTFYSEPSTNLCAKGDLAWIRSNMDADEQVSAFWEWECSPVTPGGDPDYCSANVADPLLKMVNEDGDVAWSSDASPTLTVTEGEKMTISAYTEYVGYLANVMGTDIGGAGDHIGISGTHIEGGLYRNRDDVIAVYHVWEFTPTESMDGQLYNFLVQHNGEGTLWASSDYIQLFVNPAPDCPASVTKNWTVDGDSCSAQTGVTESGGTDVLTDSTAPTIGSATFSCVAGAWTANPDPGATCSVPNTPPTASISSPPNISTVTEDDLVKFTGSGSDLDTDPITAYKWRSGNCTTGTLLDTAATFQDDTLPVGDHTIYLRVSDGTDWSTNCPSVLLTVEETELTVCQNGSSVSSIRSLGDGETEDLTIHSGSANDCSDPDVTSSVTMPGTGNTPDDAVTVTSVAGPLQRVTGVNPDPGSRTETVDITLGAKSTTLTYTVHPEPTLTFTSDPTTPLTAGDDANDDVELSWTVTDATSCTASGDWVGDRNPGGPPEEMKDLTTDQTYSLSCTGPGGTTPEETVTVNVLSQPDLTSAGYSVIPSAGFDLATGEYDYLEFAYRIENSGDTNAGNFTNSLTFDGNGPVDAPPPVASFGAPPSVSSLAAGATTLSATVKLAENVPFGAHQIVLNIDNANAISESDETNNTLTVNTTIDTTLPPPDPGIKLEITPDLVRSGDTAEVRWDVNATFFSSCTVLGQGIDETFYPETSGITTGNAETAPIKFKTEYLLTCTATDAAGNTHTFNDNAFVETVGTYEEI